MDGKAGPLSTIQQFYVAVGSPEVKLVRFRRSHIAWHCLSLPVQLFTYSAQMYEQGMRHAQTTLVDLLLALEANGPFGCAVICR